MDVFDRSNLTRTQLAFWLGQQLNPETPLFHSTLGLIVPKHIDRAAFAAAFDKLIHCCDALRTVIVQEHGVPVQRTLDRIEFTLDYVDFSAEPDPRAAYVAWSDERCHTPYDSRVRLFDSALVKLADDRYVWYFCQHHIISDMFSFIIAAHHLSTLYEMALAGTLGQAGPLPSFAAYLEEEFAQRGALGDPAQRAFWEDRLQREADPITYYGKPVARVVGNMHRENVDLGEKLSRQIRELAAAVETSAKSSHAAHFNIFAAILFAYLNRICGVARPSLGMPFHNRRGAERKQTVGLFMSVLPIAVDIGEDDTLNTLIAKIGADASAVLRNSPYFIHNLMHTQAHDILVNGLFVSFPVFAGAECEVHWPLFNNVLDPLVMNFYESPDTGNFANLFAFNAAVFNDEMRRLMVDDYDRVAHALLDQPDIPIRDIDLLSDADKQRVLIEWNATDAPFPKDQTVHQLFEAQAERTPDAVAAVFGRQTLTYHELNTRANQLAHHLKSLGVTRDTLVGLCVERSLAMPVGLLGILKAGGAYVPLDPAYPRERLAFMLEDSNIEVLVTTEQQRPYIPVNGSTVVCIDYAFGAGFAHNPVNGVASKDLAYVIYTSGSTGRPKGAAMPHRALANLVHWQAAHSASSTGSKTLQFAPLSFDVSFQEMFCTWSTGGALVLIDENTRRDSRALLDTIAQAGIERIFLPYVALQGLAQTAVDTDTYPECLKEVITAGEQLSVTGPIRTFFSKLAGCALINQYGPTESHVVSSYALRGAPEEWPVLPPIGRPIHNTSLYVLDRAQKPVPVGVPGELYIGGEGLARGYWNRPDLTGERFVSDPFANGNGGRLYRTGDIVRYRSDGNIEFLGRADHQVKIRGYRVELGEVESAILQHPGVADTVVMARQDGRDDHEMVAYVVPRAKGGEFVGELKAQLKGKLPDYMIPSAFVVLDAMPLGPNGKVDRKALPKPDREARSVQGAIIAPRDAIELELAHIWEQIFDVRPIGVADSFFDLGGHSLSAVFMMDQIQLRLGRVLSPSILFEAPTIESLADAVRRRDAGEPEPVLVPIQPRGDKTPFFCVHPAPGTVFCYIALAQSMGEARPFWGIQAPSVNGANVYFATIEASAAYYVDAVKRVRPQGPYLIGGHSSGGQVALEMARLLRAEGHEVRLVALLDSFAPLPSRRAAQVYSACVNAADDAFWLACMLMLVEYFFKTKFDVGYPELRRVSVEEQYQIVLRELVRVNFLPPHAGPGAMHGLVDNLRTVIAAAIHYGPAQPYDGNIAFLRAPDLFTASPRGVKPHTVTMFFRALWRDWRTVIGGIPHLAADMFEMAKRSGTLRRFFGEPTLGWRRMSTKPVEVRQLTGNHVTMLSDPHVQTLAANLAAALDAADVPAGGAARQPLGPATAVDAMDRMDEARQCAVK